MPFFFTALISYEAGKEYYRWAAFVIYLVASISDALDGILARVLKKHSQLGRFLDPLADKLLMMSGYLALLNINTFSLTPPLWVTVTIVFRDIIIIAGLIILFLMTGDVRIETNLLGKLTTAFQMITLGVILVQWPIAVLLWYTTAALTILSCVVYALREIRLLNDHAST